MADTIKIITKTPLRVSFFGGGTDLPEHFNVYGGSVLGTTIDKYCTMSVDRCIRENESKIELIYGTKLEQVNSIEEIEHNLIRTVLQHLEKKHSINLEYIKIISQCDLPFSSGVGSSSSFVVGLLKALFVMFRIEFTPVSLAVEAIHVEREIAQENGGWQDQVHAAFGGFNMIAFFENQFFISKDRSVQLHSGVKKSLEESCLLVFTGKTRNSVKIHQEIKAERRNKSDILCRIDYSVKKAMCLLDPKWLDTLAIDFGKQLNNSWMLKKEISNSICDPGIDELYWDIMKKGAYGGKLIGAGGGGYLLFILPTDLKQELIKSNEYTTVDFKFTEEGSKVIYHELR